ncbi:unnamed protein product [Clavelina lepadiformis]|uniref:Uncharacterized protein n=1 Tax=Clavelina lepadiformis TaxID=159417 RepID=A0ABP0FJQ6_CLALP
MKRKYHLSLMLVTLVVISLILFVNIVILKYIEHFKNIKPEENWLKYQDINSNVKIAYMQNKNKDLVPQCANTLHNMTVGKWIEKNYSGVTNYRKRLDHLHAYFRGYHEGFTQFPYREDLKCGFKVSPGIWLPFNILVDASAWCKPYDNKPCCSDSKSGKCMTKEACMHSSTSVDLAKYTHAEIADWIPTDKRCKMITYHYDEACTVLSKNKIKSIGFVGNSFMRNFYLAMIQLLSNNFYNGTRPANSEASLKKKCVNHAQIHDKDCAASAVSKSEAMPSPGICAGHIDTKIYLRGWYAAQYGKEFLSDAIEVLDEAGAFLLVGIGIHNQMDPQPVIRTFLKPVFDVLQGHKWPKIIWVHTQMAGIYKPSAYVAMHGDNNKVHEFTKAINQFCKRYSVPTLDIRYLTSGVWSQDGQHFGIGVNLMKVQFLLNILSADDVL